MKLRSFKQNNCFVQLFAFATLFLIARGIPFDQTFKITAYIAIQIFVGGEIWTRLVKNHSVGTLEYFGAGFALGSALFTIIDQLVIAIGLPVHDFVLPFLIFAITIFQRLQKESSSGVADPHISNQVLMIVLCIFLGLSELSYGSLLAVLLLTGLLLIPSHRLQTLQKQVFLSCFGIVGSIFIYQFIKPPIVHGTWFLRPLYTGTDDAVFSESIAYSVAKFGSSEYAAAQGTSLRYHWFSLAWSGMVDRVAEATPFTMTLHVVPVIAFAVIAALLIAISARIGITKKYSLLAPLILFALSSAPGPIRFFHVLNTSNVLPFVWILAFILAIVVYINSELNFAVFFFTFLLCVILLSKMPFVIAPLAGITSLYLYSIIQSPQNWKSLIARLSVIYSGVVLVFITFLTPHAWEKRSFAIDWNFLNIADGNRFRFLVAPIVAFILFFTRFPLIFRFRKSGISSAFKFFLLGASLTGLLRFIVSGSSAENYFLNSSFAFGSIGIAIVIFELSQIQKGFTRNTFVFVALFSAISSFSIYFGWSWYSDNSGFNRFEWLQFLVPIPLVGFLLLALHRHHLRITPRDRRTFTTFTMVICLLFCSFAAFIHQATQAPSYYPKGSVATESDLKALGWLRANSNSDDIVATNRGMCIGSDPCGFDESSFLISAVGHRRVLIEGPRFITGGRPYPDWVNERIELSLAFVNSPSKASVSSLLSTGVKWFFLDKSFVPPSVMDNPWNRWATLKYSEGNILIYELTR
jgi:hypothetical protein